MCQSRQSGTVNKAARARQVQCQSSFSKTYVYSNGGVPLKWPGFCYCCHSKYSSCTVLVCVLCRQCIACSRDWISLRIVRTTILLNYIFWQLWLLFTFRFPAGFVVEPLFNAFATAAFFEFVNFAIFEMQYLLSIWRARRGPALDTWQTQRELAILYIRFYGALLGSIFVTYQSQRWAAPAMVIQCYHSATSVLDHCFSCHVYNFITALNTFLYEVNHASRMHKPSDAQTSLSLAHASKVCISCFTKTFDKI